MGHLTTSTCWSCPPMWWCWVMVCRPAWLWWSLRWHPVSAMIDLTGSSHPTNLEIIKKLAKSQRVGPCSSSDALLHRYCFYSQDALMRNTRINFCNVRWWCRTLWRIPTLRQFVVSGLWRWNFVVSTHIADKWRHFQWKSAVFRIERDSRLARWAFRHVSLLSIRRNFCRFSDTQYCAAGECSLNLYIQSSVVQAQKAPKRLSFGPFAWGPWEEFVSAWTLGHEIVNTTREDVDIVGSRTWFYDIRKV